MSKIVYKNGKPLCVLRPADPSLALQLAKDLEGKSGPEVAAAWSDILEAQPYMFMGYLGEGRRILDPSTLKDLGSVQSGDSLATANSFEVPAQLDNLHKLS